MSGTCLVISEYIALSLFHINLISMPVRSHLVATGVRVYR